MGRDRDEQDNYEFNHPGEERSFGAAEEAAEDRQRAIYCQPCKEKGRKQMAHRVLPGRRGICNWCYRGEPHPEETQHKQQPKVRGDGVARTSADQAAGAGSTPDSPPQIQKEEATMTEQKLCGEPGCGKALRVNNRSGFCTKHFYRSKQKEGTGKKRGRPRASSASVPNARLHGPGAVALISLPESKLDLWWQSLSVGRKGEILAAAFFGQD